MKCEIRKENPPQGESHIATDTGRLVGTVAARARCLLVRALQRAFPHSARTCAVDPADVQPRDAHDHPEPGFAELVGQSRTGSRTSKKAAVSQGFVVGVSCLLVQYAFQASPWHPFPPSLMQTLTEQQDHCSMMTIPNPLIGSARPRSLFPVRSCCVSLL